MVSGSRAFTLLELLVTMGILGILCALLTPGLMRAREAAKQIHCVNNLRQLGVAITSYAGENDDWMPSCFKQYTAVVGATNKYWVYLVHPYLSGGMTWGGTYATTSPVLHCPAGSQTVWPYYDIQPGGVFKGVNYVYNDHLGWFEPNPDVPANYTYRMRKISSCARPAEIALILDGNGRRMHFELANQANLVEFIGFRHNNSANCLFVDGHVSILDLCSYTNDQLKRLTMAGNAYPEDWP